MGFGQFFPQILTLQEQAKRARTCESMRQPQQPGQGGAGPRGNHVKAFGGRFLHPGLNHPDTKPHRRRRRVQERAFLACGLEQGDGKLIRQHRRQHQTGKPRPRAQIGQCAGTFRDMAGKLGTVPHMAPPKLVQTGPGHQIVAAVPVGQQRGIGLQPGQCFT